MAKKTSAQPPVFNLSEHESHPGFLIRRFNQIAISLFMERMAALAITPLQYTVMRIVARHPNLTQKAIASHAVLDASTTHDIVLRLESKGFLTRAKDKSDRRSLAITLTEAGETILRASEPVVMATQKELVACLSPQQRDDLMTILAILIEDHLERSGTDGPPGPWRRNIGIRNKDL